MLIFCVFISLLDLLLCEEITVHVRRGPVRGHVVYVGEHPVYSFRNIPYAKSPVGNQRFQLPEEHDEWLSEDDLRQSEEIRCPQNAFFENEILPDVFIGQEDCLVLDVYVRKNHKLEDSNSSSIPVLVYFHGGKFNSGSKEDYGPDYLLRYNDIILVVPNYRLGILGFLSFQDATLPGNLGLWDQNAAMRWVSGNIDQFGGDPNRVTIAGHEAGAASVGLHILAPASHDYFQGAISGSGTVLSPWLVDVYPSSTVAGGVAHALRCSKMLKHEMLTCLKTASLEDILRLQRTVKKHHFVPTIDVMAPHPLIPFSPKSLYQKGFQKGVSYLVGFTESEASFEVSREFPNVLKYQNLDKMVQHFLKPHFQHTPNFEMIAKAAKYHYLRGIDIPSFESIEPHIARMMMDFLYKSPLEEVVKLQRQKSGNIFVYRFKSETQDVCGLGNRRCFGNEFYLFNTTSLQNASDFDELDMEKVTETLCGIWGNFVKLGYPDARRRWKPSNDLHEVQYAEISSNTILPIVNYVADDGEFWISLVSDLNTASNSSGEDPVEQMITDEFPAAGTWGATGLAVLCCVVCIALVGAVVVTKSRTLTMSILPVAKR